MDQEIRRERLKRMQRVAARSGPNPNLNNGGASRAQSILMMGLMLFAVGGLLTGFTVGFIKGQQKPSQTDTNTNRGAQPKTTQTMVPQPSATVDILKVAIGCPHTIASTDTAISDNKTVYTFSIQAWDKSKNRATACGDGNALKAPGITCKIWLVQSIGQGIILLPKDRLLNANTLSASIIGKVKDQPFPEVGGLNFVNVQQTQQCDNQGLGTWTYTVSAPPGNYTIIVLTDWQGQSYNWGWRGLTVLKPN